MLMVTILKTEIKVKAGSLMITVSLFGSADTPKTAATMMSVFSAANCGVACIKEKEIIINSPKDGNADFLIIEKKRANFTATSGIALFTGKTLNNKRIIIPPEFVAVIDCENTDAAEMLAKNGVCTISCGLSSKNTVTFSSHENDRAVVSLQRVIKTMGGKEYEPSDLPICFSDTYCDYDILASAAVLFLAGVEFTENGLAL